MHSITELQQISTVIQAAQEVYADETVELLAQRFLELQGTSLTQAIIAAALVIGEPIPEKLDSRDLVHSSYQDTDNLEVQELRAKLGETFSLDEIKAMKLSDKDKGQLAIERVTLVQRVLEIEGITPKERIPSRLKYLAEGPTFDRCVSLWKTRLKYELTCLKGYQVFMDNALEGGYRWCLTQKDKMLYHLEMGRTERKLIHFDGNNTDRGEQPDSRGLRLSVSMPTLRMEDGSPVYLSGSIIRAVIKGVEDGSLKDEVTKIHKVLTENREIDTIVFYINAAKLVAPMIVERQRLGKLCEKEGNREAAKKHWGYIKYLRNVGARDFSVTFYPDSSAEEWVDHMRSFWRKGIEVTEASWVDFKKQWFADKSNRHIAYRARKRNKVKFDNRTNY